MRLKHYHDGEFRSSTLRYWTGVKWQYANLKRWNGSKWETCIQNPLNDFFVDDFNSCLVKPNGELVGYHNSKYFQSPYVYYYNNKLSYRIINHYAGGAKEWSMDIEIWNPWTKKLIMTKNIPHANPLLSPNEVAPEFKSSISVTNNKVFVFYTPLNAVLYRRKGAYVTVLDLNLNIITQSNCLTNDNKIEQHIYTLNDYKMGGVTRRDATDYVYTYEADNPYMIYRGIKINYDNGVCLFGYKQSYKPPANNNSSLVLKDLYKLGLHSRLHKNTPGHVPMYGWSLIAEFQDLVSYDNVCIDKYPKVLFEGSVVDSMEIEEFTYGGMQRKLNNTKLFGVLLPKDNARHFLDGCVITFNLKMPLDSDDRRIEALSGTNTNYLTFRKIWGDPSLGYVVYENMNGVNLANKILNFNPVKNTLLFRRLPNGQTLMYSDDDIFKFTQKNNKFYISYYGKKIRAFKNSISEVYGCNKEIIE